MSGLASVLAGRTPRGIYRWEAGFAVSDVRDAVEQAGWRFAHLDGWTAPSEAELHEGLAHELGLPEHHGRNLDALDEYLRGLERRSERVVLLWDGWSTLARADRRRFELWLELLGSRADALAVLLRGEGPELDVPLLD